MDAQNLDLVKSLSYALYGVCLVVAALIGLMFKMYISQKNAQKKELVEKVLAARLEEQEKAKQALECEKCRGRVATLENKAVDTDNWISEIVNEMKVSYNKLENLIREAMKLK